MIRIGVIVVAVGGVLLTGCTADDAVLASGRPMSADAAMVEALQAEVRHVAAERDEAREVLSQTRADLDRARAELSEVEGQRFALQQENLMLVQAEPARLPLCHEDEVITYDWQCVVPREPGVSYEYGIGWVADGVPQKHAGLVVPVD